MDINSPAFKSALQATEHLGPFNNNPKISKAYATLRLLGLDAEEATKMLNEEIKRRQRET